MKFLLSLLICTLFSVSIKAETFVVCVGIANYASPNIPNLMKTENDAKAMSDFFKKGTPNVITITGRYATKSQILKSVRSQFGNAKPTDRIIFYFSGHGYREGFCPYNMTKPEEGLTFEEIVEVMAESKASEKIIFADACHSGGIRKSNEVLTSKRNNVLFFLASRGNESSLESSFLNNGYFTKYLIRGLGGGADINHDQKITASELFKYVSEEVKNRTGDRQHPVMWGKFDDNTVIVEYKKKR